MTTTPTDCHRASFSCPVDRNCDVRRCTLRGSSMITMPQTIRPAKTSSSVERPLRDTHDPTASGAQW